MAYCQPSVLKEAAAILRSWKDEEPRALWERLRAELKAGASVEGAEGVARWSWVQGHGDCSHPPRLAGQFTRPDGHTGTWQAPPRDWLANRLDDGLPSLPPTFIVRDGRAVTPEEVAKWMITTGWTLGDGAKCVAPGAAPGVKPAVTIEGMVERLRASPTFPPVTIVADGRVVTPEEVARFVQLLGSNRLIPGTIADDGRWVNAARDGGSHTDGGVSFGGEEFATSAAENAERLTQVPRLPPTFIARDGRAVTPEEVARTMVLWGMSVHNAGPTAGVAISKMIGAPATNTFGAIIPLWEPLAGRLEDSGEIGWPPVTITDDAKTITPNKLPDGVIVYCDPPYLETTGYKHDLSREEVIRMARLWSDAGATVCISEQTTIPELIADGWHGVQISFARKGQKRTFSGQQDEYLTINCKPHFIPREPEPMFDDLKVVKKPKVKVVRVSQPTEPQPINQPVQTLNLFGGNDD